MSGVVPSRERTELEDFASIRRKLQQPADSGPPVGSLPASGQGAEGSRGGPIALAELLEMKRSGTLDSSGLEAHRLEEYLSDDEFLTAFKGMTRAEFLALPKWRRDKAKKDADLF